MRGCLCFAAELLWFGYFGLFVLGCLWVVCLRVYYNSMLFYVVLFVCDNINVVIVAGCLVW